MEVDGHFTTAYFVILESMFVQCVSMDHLVSC